jgi:hypothetical protein
MAEPLPASRQALGEALALAQEILRNLELSEATLSTIALKATRLARLLNDFDHQLIFEYEAGGYPSEPGGVPSEAWRLMEISGRVYSEQDDKTKEVKRKGYVVSISQLEEAIDVGKASLAAARDPNVSISSANPSQHVFSPSGNWNERNLIRTGLQSNVKKLAERRAFLYRYVSSKYYDLKFSGIADDIFSRLRERIDSAIGVSVPGSVKRLTSVYDALSSDNSEDWSNAVHSCRRILQELADALSSTRGYR